MNYIYSVISRIYPAVAIIAVMAGIGIFITVFFSGDTAFQIALGFGGAGLVSLGLIIIKIARDEKKAQEKLDVIMAKLDEIQQELQKKEEPGKSGIAIADVISSSLKFYSEFKKSEEKEA